jgi:hypothetical protein
LDRSNIITPKNVIPHHKVREDERRKFKVINVDVIITGGDDDHHQHRQFEFGSRVYLRHHSEEQIWVGFVPGFSSLPIKKTVSRTWSAKFPRLHRPQIKTLDHTDVELLMEVSDEPTPQVEWYRDRSEFDDGSYYGLDLYAVLLYFCLSSGIDEKEIVCAVSSSTPVCIAALLQQMMKNLQGEDRFLAVIIDSRVTPNYYNNVILRISYIGA